MSYINEMLQDSMENEKEISIITEEGGQSYKIFGKVLKLNDVDVLIEKYGKKKIVIRISNIIKIEG